MKTIRLEIDGHSWSWDLPEAECEGCKGYLDEIAQLRVSVAALRIEEGARERERQIALNEWAEEKKRLIAGREI